MEKNKTKRLRVLVPSVFVTALIFLGVSFGSQRTTNWSKEKQVAGSDSLVDANPRIGSSSSGWLDRNDLSIGLDPQEHVYRAAETIELEWNVTKDTRRPDGVSKEVYLVNGEFPAPAVELRSGDQLRITVHNHLQEEGVAFHWHGLRVSNEMDGVVGVTQCDIAPGRAFTYVLNIPDDQHGTFWYHSHSDMQRADGLFGPLVIHRAAESATAKPESEKYGYEAEQVLLVGDWYHRSARDVLASYQDWKNFKIEPAPDSMLLNGHGFFECSQAVKAHPVDCEATVQPHLTLPNRTRLRVVNTGALTGFTLSLDGYEATVIQVDGGHAVEPIRTQHVGVLYPGERIDVILQRLDGETDESARITVSLDRENMRFPNLALREVQHFPISPDVNEQSPSTSQAVSVQKDIPQVPSLDLASVSGSDVLLSAEADESVLFYATISYLTEYEYRPKGFMNRTSWTPSLSASSPLLSLARNDWPRDPAPLVVPVPGNHSVDLVINNLDDKGHPFHFHGHDFQVLTVHRPSRPGAFEQFNPFDPASSSSLHVASKALYKDTVYVPSMGYAVLRFRADNPGIWLLHCHVLWHEAVGMNAAIQVGEYSADATVARSCIG